MSLLYGRLFGQFLVEKGRLVPSRLEQALEEQGRVNRPFGVLALERGFLSVITSYSIHYTKLYDLPDGHSYEGTFAGGEQGGIERFVLSGRVLLTFREGGAYDGEFLADEPRGDGEYVTAEGVSYRGSFAYGHPSGQGRYACLPPPALPAPRREVVPALTPSRNPDDRLIVVSIRDCRLYLLKAKKGGREVEREYAVATVKRGLETRITSYNVCYTKLLRLALQIIGPALGDHVRDAFHQVEKNGIA